MDQLYHQSREIKSRPSGRGRFRGGFAGLRFTRQPPPTWFSSVCGMGRAIESYVLLCMQRVEISCG